MNLRPLASRVAALEAAFRDVQATRMEGVPVLHPRLQVRAMGFAPSADEPGMAWGVLLTPWFMNLVRLPLSSGADDAIARPGAKVLRRCGTQAFDFIGAHEAALGPFEASSLFSPMFEFADQAAAEATAAAVLQQLRPPVAAARRGFLFGRGAMQGRA